MTCRNRNLLIYVSVLSWDHARPANSWFAERSVDCKDRGTMIRYLTVKSINRSLLMHNVIMHCTLISHLLLYIVMVRPVRYYCINLYCDRMRYERTVECSRVTHVGAGSSSETSFV